MDREILFRGKREDYGNWVEGGYLYNFWKKGEHTIHLADGGCCTVDPDTVGQCAAVPDMGGKTAFEGDILLPDGSAPCEVVGVIRFGSGTDDEMEHIGFWVEWAGDYAVGWRGDLGYWLRKSRIIGNIYDNPELLQGVKQNGSE